MKTKLLMIIIMLNAILSLGQVPSWSWVKTAGSSNYNESAVSMTTDNVGNIIVVGQFGGTPVTFGTTTLNNVNSNGSNDIFIVKYDSTGNVIWAKSAGGMGADVPSSIKTDAIGNIIVVGSFEETVVFGSTILYSKGINDVFIVKYDSSGNVIWANSAGSTNTDQASSMYIDYSGSIAVVGWYYGGNIVFGSDTLINNTSSSYNMFVAKYDSNGNALWARQAASTSKANTVCVDNIGNIYVAGNFKDNSIVFGSDTLINIATSYPEIFIVKYNYNGVVEWSKSFKGIYDDYATSVICDNNQNIYLAGYFGSPTILLDSITLTSNGDHDIFLIKLNSNGNILSSRLDGGTSYDQTNSISIDVTGNIYLAGYFGSSLPTTIGSYTLPNVGAFDAFVAKYDDNLNVLWAKSAGGVNDEQIKCIATFSLGNIYVSGLFASNSIAFDTIIANNTGFNDVFVAKLNEPQDTQCQAYFTYYPDSIDMGDSGFYSFFDYSQNVDSSQINVASWSWTVSGTDTISTSEEQNPVFSLNSAGVYDVCLNIVTTSGCNSDYCDVITIDSSSQSLIIDETTEITVIFSGEHTYVSDLGFYLLAPGFGPGQDSVAIFGNYGVVELLPSVGAFNDGVTSLPSSVFGCSVSGDIGTNCNNGDDFTDFAFTTAMPASNPAFTACVCDMAAPLTGTFASAGSWSTIYGADAYAEGWGVQITDCIGSDIGYLNSVIVTFKQQTPEGLISVSYSYSIAASPINDNACDYNTASYFPLTQMPEPCTLIISESNITTCSSDSVTDGAIDISVTGGTPPYAYFWSDSSFTEDISGLLTGNYFVTINDANGCSINESFYVDFNNDTINIDTCNIVIYDTIINCSSVSSADGSIDLFVTGGIPPYSYLWSDSTTTEDLLNVYAGSYSVQVTDANGCNASQQFYVGYEVDSCNIIINYTITDCSSPYSSDGAIDITVTGGTLPYAYLWSDSTTAEDLLNVASGAYTVNVTDANGCFAYRQLYVGFDSTMCNLYATYNSTPVSYIGANDGSIDVTAHDGAAPYSYLWNTGATTEDITGLYSGTYRVTITDSNPMCPDYILSVQLYEPYDENGGEIVDSLYTNIVDTCFGIVDSFYVSNVNVMGGNTITVTWEFVVGGTIYTIVAGYSGITNGNCVVYLTINCGANKALTTYMSYIHVETLTTSILQDIKQPFRLYPNPVKEILNIDLDENNVEIYSIEIYNISGQQVYSSASNGNKVQVNTSQFKNGIYIIRMTSSEQQYINRFVK